jgi:hypothetical protein
MPAAKPKRPPAPAREPRRPERKWGPFHAGVGVAVWLNSVDTPDGKRYFRTITIAPRRYRVASTGEWADSGNFRAADLQSLILALQAASDYVRMTPLPGDALADEELNHAEPDPPNGADDVPF